MLRFAHGYVVAALSIMFCCSAEAEDTCLPLLTVTGHDVTWVKYNNSIETTAKNAFCDERFLKRDQSSSFGLDVVVPIDGIPFDFGVNNTSSDALEARSKFCQSNVSTFSQNTALEFTKHLVSSDSLKSFLECKHLTVASENSITLEAQELSENYIVLSASFVRRYPGQPYPKVAQFLAKNVTCEGGLSPNDELVETPKKILCTRSGDDPVVVLLQTQYESTDIVLPARGIVGTCDLAKVTKRDNWVDSGECRMGAVLTPQLHNEPEQPFTIVISAGENERIGPECQQLFCQPRPTFENGCRFGRQIDQNISEKSAVTYLMVGSHPQMWTRGFRINVNHPTFDEEKIADSSFSISYGKAFSVDVPDGQGTRVACTIDGNKVTFDALSLPPALARYFTQIGAPVQGQGKWTVYYLVNSASNH